MIKGLLISVCFLAFLALVLLLWCVARIATQAAELETKLWEVAWVCEKLEKEKVGKEREDEDSTFV